MGYIPAPLKRIKNQPRVRDFLATACREGHLSHAYLFLGPAGSGKHEAAEALAQCVVCPNGADGTCDECIRVAHHTHPDVHWLEPGGIDGYLIEQVREIAADVPLSPVRATSKVYVLTRADRLQDRSANALLKTIEEPPDNVMFVLVARSADTVLETLVSRCQQVPFRVVSTDAVASQLQARTGADETDVRIALSVCQTTERAADFLASSGRRQVRRMVVDTLFELAADDVWDVLVSAREIAQTVSAPFEELRKRPEALPKDEAEYLSPRALKQLEQAMRREVSAKERLGMLEVVSAAESVLADALSLGEGCGREVVNADRADVVHAIASGAGSAGILGALEACKAARLDITHNVTPQLALEVMLISVKEALTCQR